MRYKLLFIFDRILAKSWLLFGLHYKQTIWLTLHKNKRKEIVGIFGGLVGGVRKS